MIAPDCSIAIVGIEYMSSDIKSLLKGVVVVVVAAAAYHDCVKYSIITQLRKMLL
jgi:hypothetical protein